MGYLIGLSGENKVRVTRNRGWWRRMYLQEIIRLRKGNEMATQIVEATALWAAFGLVGAIVLSLL